jgi:hypothetical protein
MEVPRPDGTPGGVHGVVANTVTPKVDKRLSTGHLVHSPFHGTITFWVPTFPS